MKRQLTFFTVLFICYACQNRKQEFSAVTEIKVDRDLVRDYQLPDAINIEKYVQLETSEACLIGEVAGIKYVDLCIYINSRYSDLYRFNSEGHFLNSI